MFTIAFCTRKNNSSLGEQSFFLAWTDRLSFFSFLPSFLSFSLLPFLSLFHHPIGVKCISLWFYLFIYSLTVFLICISIKIRHVFMCLLPICVFSPEKCLLKFFAHFQLHCLSLLLSCKSPIYIGDARPLPDILLANVFPHSAGCLFHFLNNVLNAQNFNFDYITFIYLFFCCSCFFHTYKFIAILSQVMRICSYVFF